MIRSSLVFLLVLAVAFATTIITFGTSASSPLLFSSSSPKNSKNRKQHEDVTKIKNLFAENARAARKDWRQRLASWPRTAPINTTSGPVVGAFDANVTVFLNIPFAASTAGENRWAPPKQRKSWGPEPLDATWYGKACPQASPQLWDIPDGVSEDCLNLNIFKPTTVAASNPQQQQQQEQELLPIFFWMFGGCFSEGSNEIWYNGANNIVNGGKNQKPVIIVTINYRLSVFGFLGGPQLQQSSPDGSTGTWGIQDQRMAVAWIQKNAKSFGGDPARITLAGESAGGASSAFFLTSPQTWHLFDKIIVESGATTGYWSTQSQQSSNLTFVKVATIAGCPLTPYNESLACMRNKSFEYFENADHSGVYPSTDGTNMGCTWAPTIDGVVIPEDPRVSFAKGIIAPVPVLAGSNQDEGTYFSNVDRRDAFTPADYLSKIIGKYGESDGSQIYQTYPPQKYEYLALQGVCTAAWRALCRAEGDRALTCATREIAFALAKTAARRQNQRPDKKPTPTYIYNYQHQNILTKIFVPYWGVFHMTELVNVWDWHLWLITDAEKKLAVMFVDMWTAFVTDGDPNPKNAQTGQYLYPSAIWDQFTATSSNATSNGVDSTLLINANETIGPFGINEKNFRKPGCDLWERLKLD